MVQNSTNVGAVASGPKDNPVSMDVAQGMSSASVPSAPPVILTKEQFDQRRIEMFSQLEQGNPETFNKIELHCLGHQQDEVLEDLVKNHARSVLHAFLRYQDIKNVKLFRALANNCSTEAVSDLFGEAWMHGRRDIVEALKSVIEEED